MSKLRRSKACDTGKNADAILKGVCVYVKYGV